jgi:hypothetical protein
MADPGRQMAVISISDFRHEYSTSLPLWWCPDDCLAARTTCRRNLTYSNVIMVSFSYISSSEEKVEKRLKFMNYARVHGGPKKEQMGCAGLLTTRLFAI